jgi:hypothetical protein
MEVEGAMAVASVAVAVTSGVAALVEATSRVVVLLAAWAASVAVGSAAVQVFVVAALMVVGSSAAVLGVVLALVYGVTMAMITACAGTRTTTITPTATEVSKRRRLKPRSRFLGGLLQRLPPLSVVP